MTVERRERMLEAVEHEDGFERLRVLVKGLVDARVPVEAVLDDLQQIVDLMPTDAEEDKVLDVMDLLVGYCAPSMRILPPADGGDGDGRPG